MYLPSIFMTITSTAINAKEFIVEEYTCDGNNINPPLTFSEVPANAKSLVLIMDDPDAPGGTYTHWTIYNMSPATLQINENSLPLGSKQGVNSSGKIGYYGPCPPSGQTHHYYFKLYAVDNSEELKEGASIEEVNQYIEGHIIEQAQLVGL